MRRHPGCHPRYRSLLALAVTAIACTSDGTTVGGSDFTGPIGTLRVLFVGNSVTYSNALPKMVERMGAAADRLIETTDVSQGGFSLADHWSFGASRDTLDEGRWDVVVFQDRASTQPLDLLRWTSTWADAARAAGAKPALFMVPPSREDLDKFPDVILAYRTAAEEASAVLYAVGDAWRIALGVDPDLPLYAPDGHPSVMGSYLAALTIYRGLTDQAPPSRTEPSISAEDEAQLQAAASAAQQISR